MLPDVLKMCSDAQLAADIHRYLQANVDSTGNLASFIQHYLTGLSPGSISGGFWYPSSSLLNFCYEQKLTIIDNFTCLPVKNIRSHNLLQFYN